MTYYDRKAVHRIQTEISDLRLDIGSMDSVAPNALDILNTMDKILALVGQVLATAAPTPPANPSQEIL